MYTPSLDIVPQHFNFTSNAARKNQLLCRERETSAPDYQGRDDEARLFLSLKALYTSRAKKRSRCSRIGAGLIYYRGTRARDVFDADVGKIKAIPLERRGFVRGPRFFSLSVSRFFLYIPLQRASARFLFSPCWYVASPFYISLLAFSLLAVRSFRISPSLSRWRRR